MIRRRPLFLRYVFAACCVVLTGFMLLYTSQSVQRREADLRSLLAEIEHEKRSLVVLEAEWARLNSPYALEQAVSKYLDIKPSLSKNLSASVPALQDARSLDGVPQNNGAVFQSIDVQMHDLPKPQKKPVARSIVKRDGGNEAGSFDALLNNISTEGSF